MKTIVSKNIDFLGVFKESLVDFFSPFYSFFNFIANTRRAIFLSLENKDRIDSIIERERNISSDIDLIIKKNNLLEGEIKSFSERLNEIIKNYAKHDDLDIAFSRLEEVKSDFNAMIEDVLSELHNRKLEKINDWVSLRVPEVERYGKFYFDVDSLESKFESMNEVFCSDSFFIYSLNSDELKGIGLSARRRIKNNGESATFSGRFNYPRLSNRSERSRRRRRHSSKE